MTLTYTDYLALSPLLIVLFGALCLLVVEVFSKQAAKLSSSLCIGALLIALYAAFSAPTSTHALITPWLYFDGFALFFTTLFLLTGLAVSLMASSFFSRFEASRGEFFFFILCSLFGLMLICAAKNFLILFLGLEILSISLYILTGYMKHWTLAHEASFKYFILGSVSTAMLLFGIALVYLAIGTTNFEEQAAHVAKLSGIDWTLCMSGYVLISASLLFKAACVPFHIWAPDVYAAASTPVTCFMAVATKAAAFAALMRLFLLCLPKLDPAWQNTMAFLAYPTLLWANFVAMQTTELRRFFAWSGISHAGFLLMALAASVPQSLESMLFYLVVYSIATLGAFACIALIDERSEGSSIHDLRGLFYSSPQLACVLTLCLLTLGGIPPMIGFFAKFYILQAAYAAGLYGLVVVGLLTAIIAAYYYLKIASVMFSEKMAEPKEALTSKRTRLAMATCGVALITLSCWPEPLMNAMGLLLR